MQLVLITCAVLAAVGAVLTVAFTPGRTGTAAEAEEPQRDPAGSSANAGL